MGKDNATLPTRSKFVQGTQDAPVIASQKTWLEGDALAQLQRTARLPGMTKVVGMPDLHPGKGTPIGAAFFSTTHIYPYLVGNDIGCGMGLFSTNAKVKKIKLDRWERRLRAGDICGPWNGDTGEWLKKYGVSPTGHERSLGTIGGGNHFAELLRVERIDDEGKFEELGLSKDFAVLLVHSGSRGLGEQILRSHVDRFKDGGLASGSEDALEYRQRHDHAVKWARVNRALIAERMASALGLKECPVLDVTHNSVVPANVGNEKGWLHRKGAAPADEGVIAIPGSRGSSTFLVAPQGDGEINCHSLAHGAGRKWSRSDAKARLRKNYRPKDLQRTELGGRVLCDDRDLLYEEAPQAYKAIDSVVNALIGAGVASSVAMLTPLMTYKVVKP